MRSTWNLARMGKKRNAYKIYVIKPEGKKQLGKSRSTWKDNIDIKVTCLARMVWINRAEDMY
jgi:hypothetical protein